MFKFMRGPSAQSLDPPYRLPSTARRHKHGLDTKAEFGGSQVLLLRGCLGVFFRVGVATSRVAEGLREENSPLRPGNALLALPLRERVALFPILPAPLSPPQAPIQEPQ